MSWKPEVLVNGTWSQNSIVFATKQEAEISAHDLMSRWLLVQNFRAVESDHPVNYKIEDGVMSAVDPVCPICAAPQPGIPKCPTHNPGGE